MTNLAMGTRLTSVSQVKNITATLINKGVIRGEMATAWKAAIEEKHEGNLKKAEAGDGLAIHHVACGYWGTAMYGKFLFRGWDTQDVGLGCTLLALAAEVRFVLLFLRSHMEIS